MCMKTCKLCYCNHRSPPKWAFCGSSIAVTSTSTAEKKHRPSTQPCEHAATQDKPPERCSGRVDFCCSAACCDYNLKAAKGRYCHTVDMVQRQRQPHTYSVPESGADIGEAVEKLKREASFHGLCESKREIFVEGLKVEQPCLFEAWALEPGFAQVSVGGAGSDDDSALRMAVG